MPSQDPRLRIGLWNTFVLIFILSIVNAAIHSNINLKLDQIKNQITAENAEGFVGIGGRYGELKNVVSKHFKTGKGVDGGIESDHFPPKGIYKLAKNMNIKNIKIEDMAAVSSLYKDHRKLSTTGTPRKGYYAEKDTEILKDLFKAGEYGKAIEKNVQVYKDHNLLDQIKPGVFDALNVHVANGLISDDTRKEIVNKYKLDDGVSKGVPSKYRTYFSRLQAIRNVRKNIKDYFKSKQMTTPPKFFVEKQANGLQRAMSDPTNNRKGTVEYSEHQTQGMGEKWNSVPELTRRGSESNQIALSSHGGFGTQKLTKILTGVTNKLKKLDPFGKKRKLPQVTRAGKRNKLTSATSRKLKKLVGKTSKGLKKLTGTEVKGLKKIGKGKSKAKSKKFQNATKKTK